MLELLELITTVSPQVSRPIYQRGTTYFREKRVSLESLDNTHAHLHVDGTYTYCVDFYANEYGLYSECNCPSEATICKHVVAAFLFLQEEAARRTREGRLRSWKEPLDVALQAATYAGTARTASPFILLCSLRRSYYSAYILEPYRLKASNLPAEVLAYPPERLAEAVGQLVLEDPALASKAQLLRSVSSAEACLNLDPGKVTLISALLDANRYYEPSLLPYLRGLAEPGVILFEGTRERPFTQQLHFVSDIATIELVANRDPEGLKLMLQSRFGEQIVPLERGIFELIQTTSSSATDNWLKVNNRLVALEPSTNVRMVEVLAGKGELTVPRDEEAFFFSTYLMPILQHLPLAGDAIEWVAVHDPEPQKQIYLQENSGTLQVQLQFAYQGMSVPFSTAEQTSIQVLPSDDETDSPQHLRLARINRLIDYEAEVEHSMLGTQYGLKRAGARADCDFVLRANVDAVEFLLNKIPRLIQDGFEIFGEETLKTARVNRNKPTIQFNISSGIDWFDIQPLLTFGDVPVKLPEVRKALRAKSRYIKLADGSIGEIPQEWLDKYKHLFQLGEQQDDAVRFSEHHLTLLDQLLAEADVRADDAYQARLQRLMSFEQIVPQTVPANFQGELRPYQKAGFDWLHFLNEFGFGGCLADDMGLGKTVQVLAFLQSLHNHNNQLPASLIVLPRSLLVNWQREAQRFTPDLSTHVYFGATRDKDTGYFDEHDLILTTYGTMRQDIELLRKYKFHYVVLDESQNIKSPVTKVSKAARLLRSERRLAMTGTPVENNTFELWSLFAFLNPGLLGSMDYFRNEFGNPIEKQRDESTAVMLRKTVYPFILRRTKNQVAPDLPPLSERVIYADMEPAQRTFYERTRDDFRAELMGLIETQGVQNARMKILEGLLRLRQICDHPKLVRQSFRGDSAKLTLLLETLDNLLAEGHKVLVFSQFVKMLTLIRRELDRQKIRYAYLDGRTRGRHAQVDLFQSDPAVPLFLISLKAGGVGLNLTAADYVIHVDPWWNPAVEMQATDRSHRIGQDKPVFAYKLITKDSVEEKIVELQERKRTLVEQVITTEASFFKELTADDVQVLFS